MTEVADSDGVSKEGIPESSEKPPDTHGKHRRRSVLRVSQLLLRAIAAHKGLTLTVLKKEFGNAGYQVRRKCSRHSSEVTKPPAVRGTLLRVSGSKAEGYFRVWKSLKPIKKRAKKSSAEMQEVHNNCFKALFPPRYRKPCIEACQSNPEDSSKAETPEEPEGPETPETPDVSDTPPTSEEKIYVEQVSENPEDMEEIAKSLAPGYSLSQKGSKKTKADKGHKAKRQKIKKMKMKMKMKMKEKSKSRVRSTEGSKRSKAKKNKKMRIKESKDKKAKNSADPEKRTKPKPSHSPSPSLTSTGSGKVHGGQMKTLDPRARQSYKGSPRKVSSQKENAQRLCGRP